MNNYTPLPATSFPKYLSPRPKKTTLRKIRYAVFGSLAVQFSGEERGGEGRGRRRERDNEKRASVEERERERETADRYGFHSRRRMGA